MTIILLRQLHDKPLRRRTFLKCLEMLTNSQSLCAVAKTTCQTRSLNPIDMSCGLIAALYFTGECPPVVCARDRSQLIDYCADAAAESLVVNLCRNQLSCASFN